MDRKKSILILCEGYEEWHYINKLLSFGRYNKELYFFPDPINVKSNSRLVPRFQIEYAKDRYDLILIFCDVDKNVDSFYEIVNNLATNLEITTEQAFKLFIFANPVTMQVVLSHFGRVELTHVAKNKNREEIEKITGIKGYNASESQIKEMMLKITFSSYDILKENLSYISRDIHDVPSTNFLKFLEIRSVNIFLAPCNNHDVWL